MAIITKNGARRIDVRHGALIISELLMGVSAVGGGIALLVGAMDQWLPATWLQGSPFISYQVPALALIIFVGAINLIAATLLLARRPSGPVISIAAGMSLIGFEIVEAAAIGMRMWLQICCFACGVIILLLALRMWIGAPKHR